jgi:putative aminopeptidase FrvX
MKSKEFLTSYLNSLSPTGFENESQQLWIDYIKQYVDEVIVDNYGTAVGIIKPKDPKLSEFKVVIEAHVDEVSFRVKYITDKGYIYVIKNGGSDHQIAPSKRVNIHGKGGIVKGFFGWPAIHTRERGTKETHPSATADNLFIDCGAKNKKEVEEMGIYVGCVMTYPDELIVNENFYTGKALDNKLGGYILSQIAKKIKEKNIELPYELYIVNSVQEEVGLRGAAMIVETIRPNVAIVIDVTHDTCSPMMSKTKNGDISCGKGPVLTYGPTIQQKLIDLIENTAIENKIDFQRKVSGRSTGTDTDSFAYSIGGVPSSLISIPLKYMHTTVETAHKDDVKKTTKLMLESLKNIKFNQDFKYLKV